MPAKGKDLTNEERAWLREWAYEYRPDPDRDEWGIAALARALGYGSRSHLSRVLNAPEGGPGFRTAVWSALLELLMEHHAEDAALFELEAASTETRREMRVVYQRRHLRRVAREMAQEGRGAERSTRRGVVTVTGT